MSKSYNFCPSTSATRSSSGCVAFINILLIRLILMFFSVGSSTVNHDDCAVQI